MKEELENSLNVSHMYICEHDMGIDLFVARIYSNREYYEKCYDCFVLYKSIYDDFTAIRTMHREIVSLDEYENIGYEIILNGEKQTVNTKIKRTICFNEIKKIAHERGCNYPEGVIAPYIEFAREYFKLLDSGAKQDKDLKTKYNGVPISLTKIPKTR